MHRKLNVLLLALTLLLLSCGSDEARPAAAVDDSSATETSEPTAAPTEPDAGAITPTPGTSTESPGPVGAWGGRLFVSEATTSSCGESPQLKVTDGSDWFAPQPLMVAGTILDADFPIEQAPGFVVTNCDGQLRVYRMTTGHSGEIVHLAADGESPFIETSGEAVAGIGWESHTSIRLGNQILDLETGSIDELAAGDQSVRTVGSAAVAVEGPLFRYLYDEHINQECTPVTLYVEDPATNGRMRAFTEQDPSPVATFKTNGVGGHAAWTSVCGGKTSLYSATIEPATGQLHNEQSHVTALEDPIEFSLNVHGELRAWSTSAIQSGEIEPLLNVTLAP